jgi:GNAT superfamily N-acetyltransferase
MTARIVYAESDADIVMVHRFLCVVAAPVLMAPINPVKSISEIWRLVNEPGYGFVLMAIEDEILVGTLGVLSTDWWYGDIRFLTDRFFFVVDHLKNKGIGKALEDEAAAVAKDLNANLIINGKMRRKGASSFVTLPRTHAAA